MQRRKEKYIAVRARKKGKVCGWRIRNKRTLTHAMLSAREKNTGRSGDKKKKHKDKKVLFWRKKWYRYYSGWKVRVILEKRKEKKLVDFSAMRMMCMRFLFPLKWGCSVFIIIKLLLKIVRAYEGQQLITIWENGAAPKQKKITFDL